MSLCEHEKKSFVICQSFHPGDRERARPQGRQKRNEWKKCLPTYPIESCLFNIAAMPVHFNSSINADYKHRCVSTQRDRSTLLLFWPLSVPCAYLLTGEDNTILSSSYEPEIMNNKMYWIHAHLSCPPERPSAFIPFFRLCLLLGSPIPFSLWLSKCSSCFKAPHSPWSLIFPAQCTGLILSLTFITSEPQAKAQLYQFSIS